MIKINRGWVTKVIYVIYVIVSVFIGMVNNLILLLIGMIKINCGWVTKIFYVIYVIVSVLIGMVVRNLIPSPKPLL